MKIVHTADLHIGQTLYNDYDRTEEHRHFFGQLEKLCIREKPHALVVSGDVFDIQQPGATVKKFFADTFVHLQRSCPEMKIVIVAGNHDSASRLSADSSIWDLAGSRVVGVPPAAGVGTDIKGDAAELSWQDNYIVRLDGTGYIIALPHMAGGERKDMIQSLLDRVESENEAGLPVVMTGHLAVAGMDPTGHEGDIGKIRVQSTASLGKGYDYLALGHIHKPQTIGHPQDCLNPDVTYPSGVIRYSGSALHVSCDEKYPHTISIVEMERHGGDVRIRQERIGELLHFYELPLDGSSFTSEKEALDGLKDFVEGHPDGGYFRFRFDYSTALPSDFNNKVYAITGARGERHRFNPKHIWTGAPSDDTSKEKKRVFEVAELQQMTDPVIFIEKTIDRYPGLDLDEIRKAFEEVEQEMRRMAEEEKKNCKKQVDKINDSLTL